MSIEQAESSGSRALKAGAWYTVGNILLKGCMFFTLPIFTRLLTTADFGIYNSYMAYEQLLTAVLGLGMYGSVKIAKIEFKERFDDYMKALCLLCLAFFVAVVIVGNAAYPLYASGLGFSRFVTNCLFAHAMGDAFLMIYGSKLAIEFKYRSYIGMSAFNILGSIAVSLLLIVFVFPNERYIGRILGAGAPLILIGVVVSFLFLRRGHLDRESAKRYARYALVVGLPLVPHALSQAILGQFDRIMINDMVGASEAGVYSYMYTLCTILYVVQNSIDNAWTPWTYVSISGGRKADVRGSSTLYIGFACILTVGFMCVMPEIARLMADESYWGGISLIAPLTLGNFFIFLYTLAVNVEYYHKKTALISIGTITASLLNILLNWLLIPVLGYGAAAYNTLFSYACLFVFHWAFARRMGFGELYSMKAIVLAIVGVCAFGLVMSLIDPFAIPCVVARYAAVAAMLAYCLANRKRLLAIVRNGTRG